MRVENGPIVDRQLRVMTEEAAAIKTCRECLKRFKDTLDEFEDIHGEVYPSPRRAAMKRASMDLTRVLARLRRAPAELQR